MRVDWGVVILQVVIAGAVGMFLRSGWACVAVVGLLNYYAPMCE